MRAQGYFGAGIGGGMNGNSGNILIKDTTLTALALPLYSSPDYTALSASAVGRGSNRVHYQVVMQEQEFAMSIDCLLYTSPSPRDRTRSRMPSSA